MRRGHGGGCELRLEGFAPKCAIALSVRAKNGGITCIILLEDDRSAVDLQYCPPQIPPYIGVATKIFRVRSSSIDTEISIDAIIYSKVINSIYAHIRAFLRSQLAFSSSG